MSHEETFGNSVQWPSTSLICTGGFGICHRPGCHCSPLVGLPSGWLSGRTSCPGHGPQPGLSWFGILMQLSCCLFSNNWWAEELVGLFSDFICQMKVKGVILPLRCRWQSSRHCGLHRYTQKDSDPGDGDGDGKEDGDGDGEEDDELAVVSMMISPAWMMTVTKAASHGHEEEPGNLWYRVCHHYITLHVL